MKRDNQKGFSLIELIVIFAIMAILMGMLSYSLNLFIGWEARGSARKLSSQLDEVKTGTMSRGNETMTLQYHAKDSDVTYTEDGIYVVKEIKTIDEFAEFTKILSEETDLIAGSQVQMKVFLSSGTSIVIDSAHPTNSVTIRFKRTNGAYDTTYIGGVDTGAFVTKIEITKGYKTVTILTDAESGKHKIQ